MKINKNILLTGGTGFIGKALTAELIKQDYTVYILSRTARQDSGHIHYILQLSELNDIEVHSVINLAGEPLAAKRWNAQRKASFISSRIDITQQLHAYFKQHKHCPETIISGSAIGYYGACNDDRLDESGAPGTGFAADLCQQWESQAHSFKQLGTRLCIVRIGVVLGPGGGPFTEMRRSFDLKVAARLGHGQQWLSWIHLEDMVNSLLFLLQQESAQGVFNCTAPEPVTNADFTLSMQKATGAFITLPLPALAMRAIVGEMADEILLVGQRVMPKNLLDHGFSFKYERVGTAIADILEHA